MTYLSGACERRSCTKASAKFFVRQYYPIRADIVCFQGANCILFAIGSHARERDEMNVVALPKELPLLRSHFLMYTFLQHWRSNRKSAGSDHPLRGSITFSYTRLTDSLRSPRPSPHATGARRRSHNAYRMELAQVCSVSGASSFVIAAPDGQRIPSGAAIFLFASILQSFTRIKLNATWF
jgi:hypothetical protein